MRWPMRRPWHAGVTITRPMVALVRAPAPALRRGDDLAVALGDDALIGVRKHLRPVGRAMRPALLFRQGMRRDWVIGGHRAQHHAVVGKGVLIRRN